MGSIDRTAGALALDARNAMQPIDFTQNARASVKMREVTTRLKAVAGGLNIGDVPRTSSLCLSLSTSLSREKVDMKQVLTVHRNIHTPAIHLQYGRPTPASLALGLMLPVSMHWSRWASGCRLGIFLNRGHLSPALALKTPVREPSIYQLMIFDDYGDETWQVSMAENPRDNAKAQYYVLV